MISQASIEDDFLADAEQELTLTLTLTLTLICPPVATKHLTLTLTPHLPSGTLLYTQHPLILTLKRLLLTLTLTHRTQSTQAWTRRWLGL